MRPKDNSKTASGPTEILKARKLEPGGVVGVIAPASPVDPSRIKLGIQELERRGYKVKLPLDVSRLYGTKDTSESLFGSASATERARALMQLFEDPSVGAIISARGGYGSAELLSLLDFKKIRESRKVFVWFSDVTVLLTAIYSKSGLVTIHGPSVAAGIDKAADSAIDKDDVDRLIALISGETKEASFSVQELRRGRGEGRTLVGNLTVLRSLLGTPWDVDYTGAVLVLEDHQEAPYRVHRDLLQLKLAGKLDHLGALVFGRFGKRDGEHGPSIEQVFESFSKDVLAETKYPICYGLELGHGGKNIPLPLGCSALVEQGKLVLVESPVS